LGWLAVNNDAAMSNDNPWLTIPLADYEAHMTLPQVGQARLLADLFAAELTLEPVDLVFAALVLEYVEPGALLDRVGAWLAPHGTLTTVLQLPSAEVDEITPSPFTSLMRLAPRLRLLSPERLAQLALRRGLRALDARTVAATGGKHFALQSFARG